MYAITSELSPVPSPTGGASSGIQILQGDTFKLQSYQSPTGLLFYFHFILLFLLILFYYYFIFILLLFYYLFYFITLFYYYFIISLCYFILFYV
jgi:hypothetical protein